MKTPIITQEDIASSIKEATKLYKVISVEDNKMHLDILSKCKEITQEDIASSIKEATKLYNELIQK